MAYVLSLINGSTDSSLVYKDDIVMQTLNQNWDRSKIVNDGIVISYTNYLSDSDSFSAISSGLWSPHYVIALGGEVHPTKSDRETYPGQIFQLVSEQYRARHCMSGIYPYSGFFAKEGGVYKPIPPDRLTIGISLVARAGTPIHVKQLESLTNLIEDLHERIPSLVRAVGRRHVTYNYVLGTHVSSDPEIGALDFGDGDIFGIFADPILNYDISWSSSGGMVCSGESV